MLVLFHLIYLKNDFFVLYLLIHIIISVNKPCLYMLLQKERCLVCEEAVFCFLFIRPQWF
ncbi:hypothetical protein Barb4_00415 [Bacteroidales bacterium Barb4]|nr:hypothetical protein Barb4_00415 [Bacteroidales bacterium Barb4]